MEDLHKAVLLLTLHEQDRESTKAVKQVIDSHSVMETDNEAKKDKEKLDRVNAELKKHSLEVKELAKIRKELNNKYKVCYEVFIDSFWSVVISNVTGHVKKGHTCMRFLKADFNLANTEISKYQTSSRNSQHSLLSISSVYHLALLS